MKAMTQKITFVIFALLGLLAVPNVCPKAIAEEIGPSGISVMEDKNEVVRRRLPIAVDRDQPQVVKTNPENGATNIPVDNGIWIKFNMDMDSKSVIDAVDVREICTDPTQPGALFTKGRSIVVQPLLGRDKTDLFFVNLKYAIEQNLVKKYIVGICGQNENVDDGHVKCGGYKDPQLKTSAEPSVATGANGEALKETYYFSFEPK